jgi:hypothetical protein
MKEFFQRFPKRCFELEKSKKKNSSGIPKNPHLKKYKTNGLKLLVFAQR